MLIVLDDVLSPKALDNFYTGLRNFDNEQHRLRKWDEIKFTHPLLKTASKYFNLKSQYRYEVWQHLGSRPADWHLDKDELLHEKGILDCPLFGLIYYPSVESLVGGQLLLRNGISIVPRSNRLVIFSTGSIWHNVEEYEGHRHSFLINFWDKKKLGL